MKQRKKHRERHISPERITETKYIKDIVKEMLASGYQKGKKIRLIDLCYHYGCSVANMRAVLHNDNTMHSNTVDRFKGAFKKLGVKVK